MPDYELTRLGSRAFEQLVVSLCRKEFGAGVQVFGDGPDGGREATFDGTIVWSGTAIGTVSADDQWVGYTVLQSKFMTKPKPEPRDNAVWLQGQIRDEIGGWVAAKKNDKRTRYPDYLIFVTNIDLSAVARTGGIDQVEALVRRLTGPDSDAYKAGLRIRGFRIWHGDQIRTMIDAHQDVRSAFDGLLTVGDVLSALVTQRPELGSLNLDDPLRQDLVIGLKADRWIRLSQAAAPAATSCGSTTSSSICPPSSTAPWTPSVPRGTSLSGETPSCDRVRRTAPDLPAWSSSADPDRARPPSAS